MLPQFDQTYLQSRLNEAKFLTVQLLVGLLQFHKQVKIERLAALFPQPILFERFTKIFATPSTSV